MIKNGIQQGRVCGNFIRFFAINVRHETMNGIARNRGGSVVVVVVRGSGRRGHRLAVGTGMVVTPVDAKGQLGHGIDNPLFPSVNVTGNGTLDAAVGPVVLLLLLLW